MSEFTDEIPDIETMSEKWEQGFHITKDGDTISLCDMRKDHLENTINYFRGREDTAPLEEELRQRKSKS